MSPQSTTQSAAPPILRAARRRHRELQQIAKEEANLSALEQARLEVESHENQIEILLSLHKEQSCRLNWESIQQAPMPIAPTPANHHQAKVEACQAAYAPSFLDRLLGRAAKQADAFESEAREAKEKDAQEFQVARDRHLQAHAQWMREKELAEGVLRGDHDAYVLAIQEYSPFGELAGQGSSICFRIHSSKLLDVTVSVNGQQAIPSEIKTLTATGRLSSRAMPKARFQEIYQDYVCGCLLRVARETFALLPVETLIVTALTDLFDSRTGHTAEQPIFSAAIPRATLNGLNFERLDPSAAMDNFLHRGDFKASRRGGGFIPITPLAPGDLTAKGAAAQAGRMTRFAESTSPTPLSNPISLKWEEALQRNELQSGFLGLSANRLAELLGMAPMESYSLYESRELAQKVEALGYCVEPDPRHDARCYFGDQEVGIFQPAAGAFEPPSKEFLGASALLRLCVFVAAADGTVDDREMDQFRQFIQGRFVLAPVELQRLAILKRLLTSGSHQRSFSLHQAPIRVNERKQLTVAQFLVDVAAADGIVSTHERQVLARIFEALSLTEDTLDTLLKNLGTPGGEVLPNAREQGNNIESLLSAAPLERGQPSFKLDMARVAAISAETAEVIGILASAMAEEEPATTPKSHPVYFSVGKPEVAEVRPKPESMAAAGAHSDCHLAGLPLKWHPIVKELTVRDAWIRADFERLAHQHDFMPLSVFEVVNEWADEHLGDFLLEGEDPVAVRRSLLPK